MSNKIKKFFTISFIDILTAVYCIFCLLELKIESYRYICFLLLSIWLCSAYISDSRAVKKIFNNKVIIYLFIYGIYYFLYVFFTRDMIWGLKYFFNLMIVESPIFIFIYYENKNKKSDLSKLLPYVIFIAMSLICINLLKLIAIDPNAARIMAAAENAYDTYITGGGYELIYGLCLIIPFLIYYFKKLQQKIIVLFCIIIFSYTILRDYEPTIQLLFY